LPATIVLFLTMIVAGCNPDDVAAINRELPPPAKVCTEGVEIPYPVKGESWRTFALNALEAAERIHSEKKACVEWYSKLRARYAGGNIGTAR